MDGALKILLLAALFLLTSAQTFNNYRSFSEDLQIHVNKALKRANQDFGAGHHVAFDSIIGSPVIIQSKLNVNVLLKVTTCKKVSTTAFEHRDECVTQKNNTPLIDCLVCMTNDDEELVDCARKIAVKNSKHTENRMKCRAVFHIGGTNLVAQKSEANEQQIGCIGCV